MSKPSSRFAHIEGKTALCYSPDGRHIITCGADTFVRVFDATNLSNEPKPIEHHQEPVTAVAISPKGDRIATGCEDNMAALFAFPSCEFEGNATRFQASVCDVAFSPSGTFLAVACDDGNIRHVNHTTNQPTILKGHTDSVLRLAYDPLGQFLASSSADGTVRLWKTDDGTLAHDFPHGYGKLAPQAEQTCGPAWHPDGRQLAVPGPRGVRLLARETWAVEQTLSGQGAGSEQRLVAYSSSGQYLAACGLDKQLFVWDVLARSSIVTCACESPVCSLSWSPVHNALAFVSADGQLTLWNNVLPSHLPHPAIATHAKESLTAEATGQSGKPGLDDPDDPDEDALDAALAAATGSGGGAPARSALPPAKQQAEPAGQAGAGAAAPGGTAPRRRLQPAADDEEDGDRDVVEAREAARLELELAIRREERLKALRDGAKEKAAPLPAPRDVSCAQAAVRPGATPWHKQRRFLAYNLIGFVHSREEETENKIEIDFNDAEQGGKAVRFTDHYRFSMAALDRDGAVFASEEADGQPATVYYRPFDSWAANSDWQLQLPSGEQPVAVTCSYKLVAVATSARNVRVFSRAGRSIAIWTARSAIVAICAFEHTLAVVEHDGRGALPDEQCLRVSVYGYEDDRRLRRLRDGPLPLSPGATLNWVGFNSSGVLATVDSTGAVRLCVTAWDHEWMPVLDAATAKRNHKGERQWIIGLTESLVLYVPCKGQAAGGLDFPPVMPSPVASKTELRVPVARLQGVGDDETALDAQALLLTTQLEESRELLREASGDEATDELRALVLRHVVELDKTMYNQINRACAANSLARALDLAAQMRMTRALETAITLAQTHKQPQLALRISQLMQLTFGGDGRPQDQEDLLFDPQPVRGVYAAAAAAQPAREWAREPQRARAHRDEGLDADLDPPALHPSEVDSGRAEEAAEPGWVDEQASERTAAAARQVMRPVKKQEGGGGGARVANPNPFTKTPNSTRTQSMTTPSSAKDVLHQLHLKAHPSASGAHDAHPTEKRKAAGAPFAPTTSKRAKA